MTLSTQNMSAPPEKINMNLKTPENEPERMPEKIPEKT